MNATLNNSPLLEQEICIGCGFCCDGTLFNKAILEKGEHGNLPEKIDERYEKDGNKEYFRQPCAYFDGLCTIYSQHKAVICSAYRCQLLRDFAKGDLSLVQAKQKISDAILLREEIYTQYQQLVDQRFLGSFRELLIEVDTIAGTVSVDAPTRPLLKLLQVKCTLFETLLISGFKSRNRFRQLIRQPS